MSSLLLKPPMEALGSLAPLYRYLFNETKKGLYCLTPPLTEHLKSSLSDQVVVQRIEERLSTLSNCIVCNNHAALTNTDIDKETEEMIADVLRVEVLGKQLLATSLWAATVPCPTEVVWFIHIHG